MTLRADIFVIIINTLNIKEIFLCKSKPSNIYKYVFHIFIKSDYNNINLIFIINNIDLSYDIFVNKFKYIKTRGCPRNSAVKSITPDM